MPIFDQGYQHWQGPLAGHGWRWLAIVRHGVRVQLKNRILLFLVLLAWIPALLLVAAVAVWGLVEQKNQTALDLVGSVFPAEIVRDPAAHRATMWTLAYSFFFKIEIFFVMLLVVVAGPGLISRDLRFNALPLYFARPLTRLDYFLGKLGVIAALVGAVAVGPALLAYVIGICFSLDVSVVPDTLGVLLASVAYGLVITLSAGTLILALSSLTRRSLYVGIAWAGLWIISGSVGTILVGIHQESVSRDIRQNEMALWLEENPPPPGVQMHGIFPAYPGLEWQPGMRKSVLTEQQKEAERWHRAWSQAFQEARARAQLGQAEESRVDWRPLCSYVANLNRIADLLLDTDSAWVTIGQAATRPAPAASRSGGTVPRPGRQPPPVNERNLADQMVAQYPWWWSAGVLTGLLGLSTWTMTRRVKSLDRLK
jgi:hypothetical protein